MNSIANIRNSTASQWWKDPGLRRLNMLLLGSMLGSVSFGYDASLMNGLLANDRWISDLDAQGSQVQGLITASTSFGAMLALVPTAYVSDLVGRRWTIMIANAAIVGAAIAQTLCQTAWTFLGTRLIIGFFDVWVMVATSALVSELSHPRQRPQATALCNTFFYVGGIIAAWASFGALSIESSWSWRVPCLLQISWPCVQSIFILLIFESPRWLVLKGREEEAKNVFARAHANGDFNDELVRYEFLETRAALEAERLGAAHSWTSLISNKGNLRRTSLTMFLGLSSQWVGNGMISYYLSPILKTIGIQSSEARLAVNGGLQIFNWIVAVLGALLAERLGRIMLLLVSSTGMLISMSVLTACSAVNDHTGDEKSGQAAIAFIFLFFGAYDFGFTPIPPLYVSEIASTHLRAKYSSLYWASSSVALCFNQYVNPIAFQVITWRYYFVYIAVLFPVILILFLYAPETKGRILEEVAAIFDGALADNIAQSHTTHYEVGLKPEIMVEHDERSENI